jgi:ABC-type phosphate transport system substrate-binding protein
MLRPGVLLLSLALLPAALGAQDATYRVVVHRTNPVSQLTRDQVSRMFLRKITQWDDRQPVLPVDQTADAPVRRSFTKQVHQKTIAAIQTWWQQQTFAGVAVAPPERAGDRDVLDYIRRYPNAIGYVRADTPLGADLKTLAVTP